MTRPLLHPPPAKVAIFRALVLGDLLCATPAWRALRKAWPDSEIVLVGLPWAAELAARLASIDRFIAFPGFPGLPEIEPQIDALPAFLAALQAERFDLALQMHGSGNLVNPLVATFGARRSAGFFEPEGPGAYRTDPSLHAPWPSDGHEIFRMLALVDHLGIARCGAGLDFPIAEGDRRALASAWPTGTNEPARDRLVCVHVGAQLPSRRWPAERFAAVADRLAGAGFDVVLTGTAGEAACVAEVKRAMHLPAIDLTGRTDLFSLGALLERARLVVCNDTGVSHVAAALRTPSVVVSSGADVARWAPLDTALHRVLWADVPCRPCAHRVCPTAHECATAVAAETVIAACFEQLDRHAARSDVDVRSSANGASEQAAGPAGAHRWPAGPGSDQRLSSAPASI